MSPSFRPCSICIAIAAACGTCNGALDVGSDLPHGLLPVDERNPVVICNDGPAGNWFGEYAILLAQAGGHPLAGIIVNGSTYWPDINSNMAGWNNMVQAARVSGVPKIPDPLASANQPLWRPANGNIDSTVPNGSAGAKFIVQTSNQLALSYRPLVVATGGALTDVADAYLMDPTVADRIVVVSTLGTDPANPTILNGPNGALDPWANTIVVQRLHYIQAGAFSNQTALVPASRLADLPNNAFGTWIASTQPQIVSALGGDEQVSVIAAMLPGFVLTVEQMSPNGTMTTVTGAVPTLVADPNGHVTLVTSVDTSLASYRFWQLLLSPSTYGK
jgi:hypothetical protein